MPVRIVPTGRCNEGAFTTEHPNILIWGIEAFLFFLPTNSSSR